jgi:hypothetical protein
VIATVRRSQARSPQEAVFDPAAEPRSYFLSKVQGM